MGKRFVCRVEECPRDGLKTFTTETGERILVAGCGDRFYGFQALCPHMEVELEQGFYDGAIITCHQHLWQWDVKTGAPVGLAEAPLQRFELVEDGGVLYAVGEEP